MSEHYELIRKSPEYRNFLMLEEMRAEMEPAWGSDAREPLEEREAVRIHHVYSNVTLYPRMGELAGHIQYLENKVNELQQKSTPKEEQEDYL